jgi:hypothetical protein
VGADSGSKASSFASQAYLRPAREAEDPLSVHLEHEAVPPLLDRGDGRDRELGEELFEDLALAYATAQADAPRIRAASAPALRAPSTPTQATGTPGGICTMDSSASRPSRTLAAERSGTPITGRSV